MSSNVTGSLAVPGSNCSSTALYTGINNNYLSISSLDDCITTMCYTDNNSLDLILGSLTEAEISEILQKMTSRNKSGMALVVKDIIKRRHFSEDFLMEYIEYFTKSEILKMHSAELISGEYSKLSLYFEAKELTK